MLSINNLTYRIQGRVLLEDANLVLPDNVKAGFVGKNGTGKTTLFHLIQQHIAADSGSIEVNKKAKIGAVAQEAPAGEETVLDVVLAADKERTALMMEAETATDPDRIGEIYTRLADIDAHTAEARASSILKGLGFEQDRQNAPTRELSGGWRMRVALAAVLFSQPDLLLLDEPTNYLDLEGTLWLEKYLATYPYTVFLISHDRDLLNKAVNSIVHLEHRKLTFYKGNYDTFEETRRMQMELNNKSREKTLEQIAHLQKFVDRFKAKASKAKQAQARVKMIEKLKPPAAMFDEHAAPFTVPAAQGRAGDADDHARWRIGRLWRQDVMLRNVTMRIDPEDRIALIGVNGNGKSTFAKLLAGDISPSSAGSCGSRARSSNIAHFAQHQMDKLKPEWTPFEHVVDLMPTDSEARRRSRLSQMGLTKSRMDTKAKNLSGGERARLLMGLITFGGPGMMILDEPTNHLDIDSRDALVHALNDYEGRRADHQPRSPPDRGDLRHAVDRRERYRARAGRGPGQLPAQHHLDQGR
jgi:ATP-binding cassette subfamily F protein 3